MYSFHWRAGYCTLLPAVLPRGVVIGYSSCNSNNIHSDIWHERGVSKKLNDRAPPRWRSTTDLLDKSVIRQSSGDQLKQISHLLLSRPVHDLLVQRVKELRVLIDDLNYVIKKFCQLRYVHIKLHQRRCRLSLEAMLLFLIRIDSHSTIIVSLSNAAVVIDHSAFK